MKKVKSSSMIRVTLFFFLAIFLSNTLLAQDLPNFLTEKEKQLLPSYLFPETKTGFNTPPDFTPRTMAEWEELDGLLITWTSYQSILSQIVKYAREEVTVYIVCSDSNSVKSYLNGQGVSLSNVEYLEAPYNSIWCRDYGPWTIYKDYTEQRSIVDWTYNRPRPSDDLVPGELSDYLGIDIYNTTVSPYRLINTGGNFMTDGHGTGFASELILDENPSLSESQIDNIVSEFMGIDRYIKMETLPYDEIHHIDMHIKLLDEETLLVGEYPADVADGPQIEENLQYILDNFKTCFGRDYKVIRIPMPPDNWNSYPNQGGDYRTYTNSVIVNGTIIVPTYEEFYDTTALRIYREAMPGYKVVGIDCNSIIPSLGAIHCITKEVGTNDPVFISHAKVREALHDTPVEIKTFVDAAAGISEVNLFWSLDTIGGYNKVSMTAVQDTFYASIPAQNFQVEVFYYIEAENSNGKKVRKPYVAPEGVYTYKVDSPIVSATINLNAGWNLLSVPLVLDDMSSENIFPTASAPVYGFDQTYVIASELLPGNGYWVKADVANTLYFNAEAPEGNIELTADWNLVGPFEKAIAVNDLTTVPVNIITTQFYGFGSNYFVADTLKPGKGYWVKASQDGSIQTDVSVKKSRITEDVNLAGYLNIRDRDGNNVRLFVSDDKVNTSFYELPPMAPGNIADARFDDNTGMIVKGDVKSLHLTNMNYPVFVSTDIEGISVNGIKIGKDVIKITDGSDFLSVAYQDLPENYELSQNYPNPFNPSTVIKFAIPEAGTVNIKIYNSLGEEITKLASGVYEAGSYNLEFMANDLPSGIYFYSMEYTGSQGNSFTDVKKMMLIK